jgi:hypothetical protein
VLLEPIHFRTYGLDHQSPGPRWLASLDSFEDTVQGVSLAHGAQRPGWVLAPWSPRL